MEEPPKLFYRDPALIVEDLRNWYQNKTGKVVLPSQPEMLIINMCAYISAVHRADNDAVNIQNYSRFAKAPILDYLAENVRITRLAAVPSVTSLRFSLVAGHGGVTIPAGIRVSTTDGKVLFGTDVETIIPIGTNEATIKATATDDGTFGNSYGVGTVTEIIDPLPFVESASNVTVTSGGAEIESDEGLRVRIRESGGQDSTAGSVKSYRFWALSANPSIIDVSVTQPVEGSVNVYPLVEGGVETPQAILDAVADVLSGDEKRPVGDQVSVLSPVKIEFELSLNITLKSGAAITQTQERVISALSSFLAVKSRKLGDDVTRSQLDAAGMNENIHSLDFGDFDVLPVDPISFAVCTGINLGYVVHENPNF